MDPLPPVLNLLEATTEDLIRRCQETLQSIAENDDTLTTLTIGDYARKGGCIACSQDYFSGIGAALGDNSNIKSLDIDLGMAERIHTFDSTSFAEGLKRNSSIRHLTIGGDDRNVAGGFIQKVLENINNNLISLRINRTQGIVNRYLFSAQDTTNKIAILLSKSWWPQLSRLKRRKRRQYGRYEWWTAAASSSRCL